MTKKQLTLLLIVFATFCLCGCFKKESKESVSPSSTAANTPAESTAKPSPSSTTTVASAPAPAIAQADGETAGTKVEVQELKRGGNSLMLKITLVNDSDKPLNFGYNFGDKDNQIKDFNTIGGVTLVDSVGKKKYFVVRDSENTCVCSSNIKDIPPKGRANLWAKFPPPPDDVQKISIIVPHFSPMDDVAISR